MKLRRPSPGPSPGDDLASDEAGHRWGGRAKPEVARSFAGIIDKLFVADKSGRRRVEGHVQRQPASAERDGGDVSGDRPAREQDTSSTHNPGEVLEG